MGGLGDSELLGGSGVSVILRVVELVPSMTKAICVSGFGIGNCYVASRLKPTT